MAKQAAASAVKKVNARDVKRAQDKDDLATLEEKASHPVSHSLLLTLSCRSSSSSLIDL